MTRVFVYNVYLFYKNLTFQKQSNFSVLKTFVEKSRVENRYIYRMFQRTRLTTATTQLHNLNFYEKKRRKFFLQY